MRVVAIDLSAKACAFAVYEDSVLSEVRLIGNPAYVRGNDVPSMTHTVDGMLSQIETEFVFFSDDTVVIEKPQQYHGPNSKACVRGDVAVMLALHFALVKRLRAQKITVVEPTPFDWKGNTPKRIHISRIQRALNPTERKVVHDTLSVCRSVFGKGEEDIIDACGIGLWFLKRKVTR